MHVKITKGELAELQYRIRLHERQRVISALPLDARTRKGLIPEAGRLPANVFDIDPDLLGEVIAVLLKGPGWRRKRSPGRTPKAST